MRRHVQRKKPLARRTCRAASRGKRRPLLDEQTRAAEKAASAAHVSRGEQRRRTPLLDEQTREKEV